MIRILNRSTRRGEVALHREPWDHRRHEAVWPAVGVGVVRNGGATAGKRRSASGGRPSLQRLDVQSIRARCTVHSEWRPSRGSGAVFSFSYPVAYATGYCSGAASRLQTSATPTKRPRLADNVKQHRDEKPAATSSVHPGRAQKKWPGDAGHFRERIVWAGTKRPASKRRP